MGGMMRHIAKWFRRSDSAATEDAEREQARKDAEIRHLKLRAARKTDPYKARHAAAERLAKLAGAGLLFACHDLTPRQQERLELFECRVHAVAPLLCEAISAEDFVRDVTMGKVDPIRALMTAGATVTEIQAVAAAWRACEAEPAPADAGVPQVTPATDRL